VSKAATSAPPRPSGTASGWRSLLTTDGRASRSFRFRVGAAFAVIIALHVLGLGLLTVGVISGAAGAVTVSIAAIAYFRGLVHSYDFDHVSMIDNSTRKFVSEGRDPASVGLAFSAGHSTVVVLSGILVIAGAGIVRTALDQDSGVARTLGIIGLSVSGLYLILVAVANLATFGQALRLKRALAADPDLVIDPAALTPRGPAARIMTAPLRRIRHPRHVYAIGFLFSLGFDTSSQIGLMILTAGAALAGAPAISLLCLPILFTAAMTLGDTLNGLMMLRMYSTAHEDPKRKINYNLLITGIGIVSGLIVGTIAVATLLTEQGGVGLGLLTSIAAANTAYAGTLIGPGEAGVAPGGVATDQIGGPPDAELLQSSRGQARGVALLADHDHLQVVRRVAQPRVAGRVEPPLQHVALDHHRLGQLTFGGSLGGGSDVDQHRTPCAVRLPRLTGRHPDQAGSGVGQHVVDRAGGPSDRGRRGPDRPGRSDRHRPGIRGRSRAHQFTPMSWEPVCHSRGPSSA
jgi:high-affinity nickel-transport protein